MAPSTFVDSLREEERVSYFTKLEQLGFFQEEDDPFLVEEKRSEDFSEHWSTSVELWPEVEFGNVYVYLADCPGYTHQSLKAYKSLEAYNYFVNGWVHQLYVRQSHTGFSIIRGTVNRSHNESYKAWVGFSHVDGSVITGYCTCMAGNSSASICTHVAAIMFQVEAVPHLACSKASACLICPYHCNKQIIKQEEAVSAEACFGEQNVTISSEVKDAVSSLTCNDPHMKKKFNDAHLCDRCNLTFSTRYLLESHMKNHHSENSTSVEDGSKLSKQSLEGSCRQKGSLKDVPVHPCKICSYAFTYSYRLKRHMETQHPEEYLQSDSRDSCTEKEKTSGKKVFTCNVCGKIFRNKGDYRRHKGTHIGEKTVVCKECHKVFVKGNHLLEHLPIHTGERAFQCNTCNRSFPYRRSLRFHMSICKGENNEIQSPHECNVCGKILRKGLKLHMRTHTGEKPFKCDECGMSFARSDHLQRHIKTKKHFGEKPPSSSGPGGGVGVKNVLPSHSVKMLSRSRPSCEECGKSFRKLYDLKVHMRKHTGEKPFKCDKCDKSFSRNAALQIHLNKGCDAEEKPLGGSKCSGSGDDKSDVEEYKSVVEKSHKCHECGKIFTKSCSLKIHMRAHTGEKPYACIECNKRFVDSTMLSRHIKTDHRKERPHKCEECGKCYTKRQQLVIHIRSHTGERPFQCNECGKSMICKSSLRKHMEIHTGIKPHMCDVCGRRFQTVSHLNTHMRIHTGEKPFSCKDCGRTFHSSGSLQVHVLMHSTSRERNFICHVCGKGFYSNGYLKIHTRLHTGEKPYKCEECGRGFSLKFGLQSHMATHSKKELKMKLGEALYKCKECENCFTRRSALVTHMQIHVKENPSLESWYSSVLKPFVCNACGMRFTTASYRDLHFKIHTNDFKFKCFRCNKSFTTKLGLVSHERTHTGEKPYVCKTCNKSFSTNSNLIRHKRIHTGEKPFKCNVCGSCFSSSTPLHSHMRTHTGEKPYKCNECGQAFTENRSLLRHKRKHGGDVFVPDQLLK